MSPIWNLISEIELMVLLFQGASTSRVVAAFKGKVFGRALIQQSGQETMIRFVKDFNERRDKSLIRSWSRHKPTRTIKKTKFSILVFNFIELSKNMLLFKQQNSETIFFFRDNPSKICEY